MTLPAMMTEVVIIEIESGHSSHASDFATIRYQRASCAPTRRNTIATHKAKMIDSFLQECDRSSMSDTYVRIGKCTDEGIGKCTDEDDFYMSPTEYFRQEEDIVCGVDDKRPPNTLRRVELVIVRVDRQRGGTGKTSCVVKNVIAKLKERGGSYLLLSPTHAAKKNALREIEDEHNAQCYQTIHFYTYPYTELNRTTLLRYGRL